MPLNPFDWLMAGSDLMSKISSERPTSNPGLPGFDFTLVSHRQGINRNFLNTSLLYFINRKNVFKKLNSDG